MYFLNRFSAFFSRGCVWDEHYLEVCLVWALSRHLSQLTIPPLLDVTEMRCDPHAKLRVQCQAQGWTQSRSPSTARRVVFPHCKKKKKAGFAVRGAPAFVGVLSVVLPTLTLSHQVDTGGKA